MSELIDIVKNFFLEKNTSGFNHEIDIHDNSIFFIGRIGDKNVYLEVFLDNDEAEIETIVNVYQGGECIFAYGGPLESCIEKLKLI